MTGEPESTPEKLLRLRRNRAKKIEVDSEYEALVLELIAEGAMEHYEPFTDIDGTKRYAIQVVSESLEVDLYALYRLVDAETYAEVVQVKLDPEAFRKAVAAERIEPEVVAKVARLKAKRPYIAFRESEDDAMHSRGE